MKKSEVISIYSFLGNGVKVSALSTPEIRVGFVKLIRELRAAALGIFDELKVTEEPAFEGNAEEVRTNILNEPYEGTFTKIDGDVLLTIIADSKIEVPIAAVFESFDEIIK